MTNASLSKEPTNPNLKENRLLRWPEVKILVGICRSHAHNLIQKGEFPSPIKLTKASRSSAWIESEIHEWINQRIEESRQYKSSGKQGNPEQGGGEA